MTSPICEQQMPPVAPLYIINEDMTAEGLVKAYLLPMQKVLIEIKEEMTGNTFRVSLRWFNDECRTKLYANLVDLVASHLKYYSLNDAYALNVVKQNMVMRYLDDEDEFVTIRSWFELAHAVCHIVVKQTKVIRFLDDDGEFIKPEVAADENNLLKLVVKFPKKLFKMNVSPPGGGRVRVINVSKTGAEVQCGGFIFSLKKKWCGSLVFCKQESTCLARLFQYEGTCGFHSQTNAGSYLFVYTSPGKGTSHFRPTLSQRRACYSSMGI